MSSLLETQEIFSQQTLESALKEAKLKQRDYIFAFTQDPTGKRFFFDGQNLIKQLTQKENFKNPLTNLNFSNISFYIVTKALWWRNKCGLMKCAEYLCDFSEYRHPFFCHLIDRSVADAQKHPLLECNVILDVLMGRGIAKSNEEAFYLAKAYADSGNPHCMLVFAFLCRTGIALYRANSELGDDYYNKAEIKLGKEKAQEYYDELVKEYNKYEETLNENDNAESSPDEIYRSRKLYQYV